MTTNQFFQSKAQLQIIQVTDFLGTFCAVLPDRRYVYCKKVDFLATLCAFLQIQGRYVSCKKWADSYSPEGMHFYELNFVHLLAFTRMRIDYEIEIPRRCCGTLLIFWNRLLGQH